MPNISSESAADDDRRFVVHPGLVTRRIATETIVVPVSSRVGDLDAVYTLTEVGSRVWALLAQPISIRQIANVICAEYDVTAEVAVQDVAAFLDELLAKKLVDLAEPSGA